MNERGPRGLSTAILRAARRRSGLLLALVVALALLVPATAQADSIVFIRDSNVWLANGSGTGAHQVTRDGTAADPYRSPSQANDGTILALRGEFDDAFFYRMNQAGKLLAAPFTHSAPGSPAGAAISPDGRYVAYHYFYLLGGEPETQTFVSYADRFTPSDAITAPVNFQYPAWMSNSLLYLSFGAQATYTYRLGDPDATPWFAAENTVRQPDVTPANDLIVTVGNDGSYLDFLKTNGPPPAEPTQVQCRLGEPNGGDFESPTWRPDGGALAWQEGNGIWAANFNDSSATCEALMTGFTLILPGASEPDWGPANINPGAQAPCENPGNPVACGPPEPTAACLAARAQLKKAKAKLKKADGKKAKKKAKAKVRKAKAAVAREC